MTVPSASSVHEATARDSGSAPRGLRRALQRALDPAHVVYLALAVGLLVTLPSLRQTFFLDDYAHTRRIVEHALDRFADGRVWSLYAFARGGPDGLREGLDRGDLVWWTDPNFRMNFLRPLSSALRVLDHRWFGDAPLGYHAHSIAWYLVLIAGAALFYRRALPGRTGVLATLLFTVATTHAGPVVWIAARHVSISAALALLGLAAYLRYRQSGWRPGIAWALLGIGAGLGAGEVALCAVAYVASYECFGRFEREESWRSRAVAALPIGLLAFAYLVVYAAFGFGAAGGDAYQSVFSAPGAFAAALVERIPIALGDLFAGVSADLASGPQASALALIGLAVACVVLNALRVLWPGLPREVRVALRWLLPGAALALVVSSAGIPSSRGLMFPSLGASALIATLLRFGWSDAAGARRASFGFTLSTWGRRALIVGLGLVHGLLAVVNFAAYPSVLNRADAQMRDAVSELGLPDTPPQDVYILAPDPASGFAALHLLRDRSEVRSTQLLSQVSRAQRLTRLDERSLRLAVVGGNFVETPYERIVRSSNSPMRPGERVSIHAAVVEVVAVDRGRPTAIDVVFDTTLDDPARSLVAWKDRRFQIVAPPPVGTSLTIPAVER